MSTHQVEESFILWLRRYVGKRRLFMIGSVAAIRDEAGRILAMRRADNDTWCFPGGAMELGETLVEGLIREVGEETGLQIEPRRIVGLYTSPGIQTYTYPNGDQIQSWSALFECRIVGGQLGALDGEAVELGFFPPEQVPFSFPVFEQMTADLLTGREEAAFDAPLPGRPSPASPETEDYYQYLRRYVGHALILAPAASACIRDRQGRVLLQRRDDNGLWGFPGGGQNLGESAPQAMVREVREETGLRVEPLRLIGLYSDPAFAKTYANGDQIQPTVAFFEARTTGGRLSVRSPETLELAYFALDDLPPMQDCCQVKARDARAARRAAFCR